MDIGRIATAIAYFFLGIIEVLLGFRFILMLLAANSNAVFTDWVYASSAPFVAPFNGVFPSFDVLNFTLELASPLAMIAYGVAGAIIIVLLRTFVGVKVNPTLPAAGHPVSPTVNNPLPQAPPTPQYYAPPPQPVQHQPAVAMHQAPTPPMANDIPQAPEAQLPDTMQKPTDTPQNQAQNY